tara:strand:+ start:5 stop:142 length:138 start_codon:yes stop_codon:yes gene_type:complete
MLHSYGKKSPPAKPIAVNKDLEELKPEVEFLEEEDECNLGDDLEQ